MRTAALVLMLAACNGDAENKNPGLPLCADAPVVTWENWGHDFLTHNCQACHASTSNDRGEAPESIAFDSKEQALALKGAILAMATGDAPAMPPSGGVTDDDRYLLEVWLTCWE